MNNICHNDGTECVSYELQGKLMCHYRRKDFLTFIPVVLLFWIVSLAGIITSYLNSVINLGTLISFFIIYIIYMGVFFQIWENKVLCSHCPFYSFENEKRLRCYANAGIYKMWSYNPSQMTKSEKIQFLIDVVMFWIIPAIYLVIAESFFISYFSYLSFCSMDGNNEEYIM